MNRFIRILSFLIGSVVMINISSFDLDIGQLYYFIMALSFIFLLLIRFSFKFNFFMIWLVLGALVSIFSNDIPHFFKPFERFIAFVILLLLISPLVRNSTLKVFRWNLFYWINFFIVLMVLGSVIGQVTGIYYGKENRQDFTGLFAHSMILGPMSGISLLISLFLGFWSNRKMTKILFFLVSAISFIGLISAASRIALFASFISVLFFFFRMFRGKFSKYVKYYIVITFLIVASYPIWKNQAEFFWHKMEYSEKKGSLLATRDYLWEERIYEFASSPVFGIGFASVDTRISSNFEKEGGKIEPGSSWLAVLSMIGLFGFLPFLMIFLSYSKSIYTLKKDTLIISLLGSLLVFMIFHMFAEGYVFSAGSGMFFYLWLLLGAIDVLIRQPNTLKVKSFDIPIKKNELIL